MAEPPTQADDLETREVARTLHGAATEASSPPGPAPAFAPGSLLAGRYRVVRFLGQGGMGQVFEAFDLELKTPVALKTLRPQAARDEVSLERFRREILLARRVSHPNVCRIFDVGQHPLEDGGTSTFLTMELLPGESLDRRLRRGRLLPEEAQAVASQLAEALDAAHAAGVVHRDFKSGNVMLVPAEGGTRAVVTDFGQALARDRGGRFAAALTVDGTALGTPAYMSPEQLTGGEVGPAADIYAFGVVLYEMVTGRWPFPGDSPLSVAARRLSHAPVAPRRLVPDLPPRWERVILRCLERDPRDRFARAADATAALGGARVPAGRRQRLRRWSLVAAAALAAGAAWMLALRSRPETAARTAPAAAHPRRSIAVLEFRDLSDRPESAWLATALAEMLTTELAAGGSLRAIPVERVAPTLADLDPPGLRTPAAVQRLGERLGADLVATGTYLPAGDRVRLDVRVLDTRSGDSVASLAETGELLTLVPQAGRGLRAALGEDRPLAVAPARPASSRAARSYSEGLDLLRRFDLVGAAQRLEEAVAADPDFAPAHAALSEALGLLGRDARARTAAERALALSAGLDREERLGIEARAREAARDWPRAIEAWGVLAGYFPDNLEHGLRLAGAQVAGGQARLALATLERLRTLPAPASQDPRLDLVEAAAAEELGDFRRELEAARRAEAGGSGQGQRLLVARARRAQGFALLSLGQRDAARTSLEQARSAFHELGDRLGEASVVRIQGIALSRGGDRTGARARYEEVLRLCREIGARGCEGGARNNLAILLKDAGNLEAAAREYEAAASIAREVGDRPGEARVLNNMAIVLRLRGDQRGARHRLEQALALTRELGLRDGEARVRNNLAALAVDRADLAEAQTQAQAALDLYRGIGEQGGVARALDNLAAVEVERDRLQAARALLEESLAIRRSLGSKEAGDSRAALAALALAEGRAADARREAAGAAADQARAGQAAGQAIAHEVEARACLAAGDRVGARQAIDAGLRALGSSPGEPVRTALAIAAARLLPAGAAAAGLRQIAGRARASDLELLALEADLAGAQASSPLAGSDEPWTRLRGELEARGLARLARLAAASR